MKKTIMLLLSIFMLAGIQNGYGQSSAEKKAAKTKAKEDNQNQELAEWEALKTLIVKKDIVFMGGAIKGLSVDPKINFLKIVGDDAVIQFANGFGGGPNGIGGITLDGRIDNYQIKADKPGKEITLRLTIVTRPGQGAGTGPVNISLSAFSFNSARITIGSSGVFMSGDISSNEDSIIFKGNTLN